MNTYASHQEVSSTSIHILCTVIQNFHAIFFFLSCIKIHSIARIIALWRGWFWEAPSIVIWLKLRRSITIAFLLQLAQITEHHFWISILMDLPIARLNKRSKNNKWHVKIRPRRKFLFLTCYAVIILLLKFNYE